MLLPNAYVTLLFSASYIPGALVLAQSLKDKNVIAGKLVCLIPKDKIFTVHQQNLLLQIFDELIQVDIFMSSNATDLDNLNELTKRPELVKALTKVQVFKLWDRFDKILYLDCDMLVLQNLDHLLNDIQVSENEIYAVPDSGWPDIFNSGLFLIKPSKKSYEALFGIIQNSTKSNSFDGADQGLLNEFYTLFGKFNPLKENRGASGSNSSSSSSRGSSPESVKQQKSQSSGARLRSWKPLSFLYNVTPTGQYQYNPAFKRFYSHIKVLHFIGSIKPWHNKIQSYDAKDGSKDTYDGDYESLIKLWWNEWYKAYGSNNSVESICGNNELNCFPKDLKFEKFDSDKNFNEAIETAETFDRNALDYNVNPVVTKQSFELHNDDGEQHLPIPLIPKEVLEERAKLSKEQAQVFQETKPSVVKPHVSQPVNENIEVPYEKPTNLFTVEDLRNSYGAQNSEETEKALGSIEEALKDEKHHTVDSIIKHMFQHNSIKPERRFPGDVATQPNAHSSSQSTRFWERHGNNFPERKFPEETLFNHFLSDIAFKSLQQMLRTLKQPAESKAHYLSNAKKEEIMSFLTNPHTYAKFHTVEPTNVWDPRSQDPASLSFTKPEAAEFKVCTTSENKWSDQYVSNFDLNKSHNEKIINAFYQASEGERLKREEQEKERERKEKEAEDAARKAREAQQEKERQEWLRKGQEQKERDKQEWLEAEREAKEKEEWLRAKKEARDQEEKQKQEWLQKEKEDRDRKEWIRKEQEAKEKWIKAERESKKKEEWLRKEREAKEKAEWLQRELEAKEQEENRLRAEREAKERELEEWLRKEKEAKEKEEWLAKEREAKEKAAREKEEWLRKEREAKQKEEWLRKEREAKEREEWLRKEKDVRELAERYHKERSKSESSKTQVDETIKSLEIDKDEEEVIRSIDNSKPLGEELAQELNRMEYEFTHKPIPGATTTYDGYEPERVFNSAHIHPSGTNAFNAIDLEFDFSLHEWSQNPKARKWFNFPELPQQPNTKKPKNKSKAKAKSKAKVKSFLPSLPSKPLKSIMKKRFLNSGANPPLVSELQNKQEAIEQQTKMISDSIESLKQASNNVLTSVGNDGSTDSIDTIGLQKMGISSEGLYSSDESASAEALESRGSSVGSKSLEIKLRPSILKQKSFDSVVDEKILFGSFGMTDNFSEE